MRQIACHIFAMFSEAAQDPVNLTYRRTFCNQIAVQALKK